MKELSVAATVTIISQDMKVLALQRRADDTFPSMWTVPGGKIKSADFDFIKSQEYCYYLAEYAAIREVKEETGIEVALEDIRFLCSLYLKEVNRLVIAFYAVLPKKSEDFEISLFDNQAYKWLNREEVKNYNFIPDLVSEIEATYEMLNKRS